MSVPIPPGSGHPTGDGVIDRDSSGASSGGISNDTQPTQPARGGPTSHDWSVNVGTPPSGSGVEQAYKPGQPVVVTALGPGMRQR